MRTHHITAAVGRGRTARLPLGCPRQQMWLWHQGQTYACHSGNRCDDTGNKTQDSTTAIIQNFRFIPVDSNNRGF